jgi:TatD DNase family protein
LLEIELITKVLSFYRFIIHTFTHTMYVDIHTHESHKADGIFIQNLSSSEAESILSLDHQGYYTIGIHPWFANQVTQASFLLLEELALDHRVVAIGECGLDKHSKVPLEEQAIVFEKQIELSEKLQKAMIIHCVACFNELLEIKRRIKPTQLWIIHGFRGKPELAKQVLKANCALSFGAHFNVESVKLTPLDKLYVETDESNLSIAEIYSRIAIVKGCKMEEFSAGIHFLEITN